MVDFEKLCAFNLERGNHSNPEDGLCAMEAVAWLEGERHSDHPSCVDPDIREFVITMNDWYSFHERQKLIPYLPKLVGTGKYLDWDCNLHDRKHQLLEGAYELMNDYESSVNISTLLQTLDEILALYGPPTGFSKPVEERIQAYRELTKVPA